MCVRIRITAIPKILEQIDILGAIITSDAMGCQKDIAKKICDNGADYVLALKGNQGSLAEKNFFNQAETVNFEGISCDAVGSKEVAHGRTDKREIYVIEDIDYLGKANLSESMQSIRFFVLVEKK